MYVLLAALFSRMHKVSAILEEKKKKEESQLQNTPGLPSPRA